MSRDDKFTALVDDHFFRRKVLPNSNYPLPESVPLKGVAAKPAPGKFSEWQWLNKKDDRVS
jgi:hypothetical protein